jgi:hypothetical protein
MTDAEKQCLQDADLYVDAPHPALPDLLLGLMMGVGCVGTLVLAVAVVAAALVGIGWVVVQFLAWLAEWD